MSSATARRKSKGAALSPRVKIWLEIGGEHAFGLGICEILLSIDRAGSIKQAAAELGKSYRHVWQRVREAERALGQPLVEARVGGQGLRRSDLTPVAHRLVGAFATLRDKMLRHLGEEFVACFRET
jgi:molybdate transport system regulatory protein